MHAASVYPEPGSNSLMMVYVHAELLPSVHTEEFACSYSCKSCFKIQISKEFSEPLCFVVVQFSRNRTLIPFLGTALIVYHAVIRLSTYFFKKCKIFFRRQSGAKKTKKGSAKLPICLYNMKESQFTDILAAVSVFSRSIVIVIGPTPPGTGVIADAFSLTDAKSTSPVSLPSARLFIPTSMTTAPSLT